MAQNFRCRTFATASGHLVAVSGEVDIAAAPSLAETLVQFANGDVIVDLSDVTFMDASGLHALMAAQRHIERRKGRLVVQDASPVVRSVFEITGRVVSVDVGSCVEGASSGPTSRPWVKPGMQHSAVHTNALFRGANRDLLAGLRSDSRHVS